MTPNPRHILILGPTCSWKSETALTIARRRNSEIISCDSMQVYRGLEIGTAQPSPEEQALVPHHLICCRDISQPYDVNIFLSETRPILRRLEAQGKSAVIVGGTGLYARSLVYGHQLLPSDKALAEAIRAQDATSEGHQTLLSELARAAGGIHKIPQDLLLNPRHFTRACEVFRLTGALPWILAKKNTTPSPEYRQFILLPEFSLLKERIRLRTRRMLQAGWVEEAKRAFENGLMQSPTAHQALGYRDIYNYLQETPRFNQEELCTLLANRTIQYARRQYTWFRHQHPGATLLTISSSEEALSQITE